MGTARRGNKNKKSSFLPQDSKYGSQVLERDYFNHYYNYLRLLTYQLFEWHGLPISVDPRFLEKTLHNEGYCALYKDPDIGYIVTSGAINSRLDAYGLPKAFQANMVNYHKSFGLYNYIDTKPKGLGVMCYNNDLQMNSLMSINLFANDLAELKNIIRINQNAQKTPVALKANQKTMLSVKAMFNQIDGNAPVIITDESVDISNLSTLDLKAPVVFPQLNDQKNNIWNEFMTWLGIDNTNLMKKERMITSEVDGNQDQVINSGNIMLKSRQEFCKKVNEYYGLNISVNLRVDVARRIASNVSEKEEDGKVHGKSL